MILTISQSPGRPIGAYYPLPLALLRSKLCTVLPGHPGQPRKKTCFFEDSDGFMVISPKKMVVLWDLNVIFMVVFWEISNQKGAKKW